MSVLSDDLYLDNIDEYIQDEDRIVTYKWLSRTLSVPVTAAKRMLYAYIERCRSKNVKVTATFIITGESNTDNSILIQLISEEEIEETKKLFNTIKGIHVYSVQKALPKDTPVLYNYDYQCMMGNLDAYNHWNTIHCPDAIKSRSRSTQSSNSKETIADESLRSTKLQLTELKEMKKKPLGFMSSFFNKTTQQKSNQKSSDGDTKQNTESKKEMKKKSDRSELQNKKQRKLGDNRKQINEDSCNMKDEVTAVELNVNKESHESEDFKDEDIITQKFPSVEVATASTAEEHHSSCHETSNSLKKKRKRIQNLSSDESDSELPEEKQMTHTSPKKKGKKRKRVKKLVSKMFADKDGSMVTEKHWEDVSTDASSDEEKPPPVNTSPAKSPSKNKKAKQSSLTSYFIK